MHEFIELADEAGLQLPDVSQEFGQWFGGYRRWLISLLKAENPMQDALKLARSEFGKRENFPDRANWPCGYILPFLGLARHYGLPTRLLDWSWNPLVGAFFAARDIMRNLDDQKDFPKTASVWAVARKCTGHITFLPEPHPQLLRTERCYNSGNPHMHAQRGIFTCCPTSCNNFWDEEATGGLDIVLYDRMEFIRCQDDNVASEILLYRFQFKREIYGELLYLLARHGVKGHLLFPSFHGVASSLTERFHYCDQGVGESRGEDPSVQ